MLMLRHWWLGGMNMSRESINFMKTVETVHIYTDFFTAF